MWRTSIRNPGIAASPSLAAARLRRFLAKSRNGLLAILVAAGSVTYLDAFLARKFRRSSTFRRPQGRRAERLGSDSGGSADLSKFVREVRFLAGGDVRCLALATISLAEVVAA